MYSPTGHRREVQGIEETMKWQITGMSVLKYLQRLFFILFIAGFFKPANAAIPFVSTAINSKQSADTAALEVREAFIYAPGQAVAAQVLREEVMKRTGLQWSVTD